MYCSKGYDNGSISAIILGVCQRSARVRTSSLDGASAVKLWLSRLPMMLSLVLLTACRGQETQEAKLARLWKEDGKACDKFAYDRQAARDLLAYDPEADLNKTARERREEGQERFANLRVKMRVMAAEMEEDTKACLRGRGWTREVVDELTERDRVRRRNEADQRERERKSR
jgi:hypothetical protein